ncbi:MAG: hypothetical protein OI74_07950 [Gammaproteobacteria bacterium (ex Lamellibrachia satsuma)]|nr:MAG: hypothetical protein HPY30_04075 [Gammaproteobacteria bacterium (ex Lamellibrachia satsuma)]RRS33399.1 MAG: hypothetical protein OI74_07950 [Gammaproteobacteria bacterium (ex Lamellibrachia satsuma)]RRS35052.1 MAG: hypothetical protein NV67_11580 [Gammaproteobacteria bacterium (ex Lamellibrachia satsuma)]
MKKLSDDLKRMLTGLAHQDAGEFLSMRDKMKVLGMGSETRAKPSPSPRKIAKKTATHRIAFISDGRGVGAPLAYAIDACSRQGAKIDLLIHGTADTENISALENQIRVAGLDHHRIPLGMNPVDDIINYICNHLSLIFLVAMPDDDAAKILIEEAIPKRGGRIPVPLVLIEDRPSPHQAEQSAA